jgi:Ca2+-binding EF-hand superfamily protein
MPCNELTTMFPKVVNDENDELLLDFPQKPRMLTEHRRQASRQLSIRRAVNVASASNAAKLKSSNVPSIYVRYARAKLDLDLSLLNSELSFLDCLRLMDHDDRIDTLFELFDNEGNQLVDIKSTKLIILERMNDPTATTTRKFKIEVEKLFGRYERFDDYFDRPTFASLMVEMQNILKCSNFLVFCTLIAQKVAFNEDTRKILEDAVQGNVQKDMRDKNEVKSLDQFSDAIIGARISLIFSMLDSESTGIVCFTDIAKHLFHFSESLDSIKRQILLTCDKNDTRTLNYNEFAEFMLNIAAIVPEGINFHDLADAVTLSFAKDDVSDEDLEELMMNHDELMEKAICPTDHANSDWLQAYGRLQRLFDMLDKNHDKFLNFHEIRSLLERYTPSASEACNEALFNCYDANSDGRLEYEEFSDMIVKFAGKDVDPHKLIDYLCVQVALDDNMHQKQAYANSLHSLRAVGTVLRTGIIRRQTKQIPVTELEKNVIEEIESTANSEGASLMRMIRRKSAELNMFKRRNVGVPPLGIAQGNSM